MLNFLSSLTCTITSMLIKWSDSLIRLGFLPRALYNLNCLVIKHKIFVQIKWDFSTRLAKISKDRNVSQKSGKENSLVVSRQNHRKQTLKANLFCSLGRKSYLKLKVLKDYFFFRKKVIFMSCARAFDIFL